MEFQMCNLDAKAGMYHVFTPALLIDGTLFASLGFLSLFYLVFYISR